MSDILAERVLKQDAVYWAPAGVGDDGSETYDPPIGIKCRWDEMQTQFVAGDGSQRVSLAVVMVDRDLELNGVLWEGLLSDPDLNQDDPFDNVGAYEIQGWGKIANRLATKFVRTAYLGKRMR